MILLDAVSGLPPETTFVGQGILATILMWFMWRSEKKQEACAAASLEIRDAVKEASSENRETIDRLSNAILLQTMAHPNFPEAAKPAVNQILEDIKEAAAKRKHE